MIEGDFSDSVFLLLFQTIYINSRILQTISAQILTHRLKSSQQENTVKNNFLIMNVFS